MANRNVRSVVRYLCALSYGVGIAAGCGGAAQEPAAAPVAEETQAVTNEQITTASGLQYIILEPGQGREAALGDRVSVHYTGWLLDGTKFDSSVDRGKPFEFHLSPAAVIEGWAEGVQGMRVGERRQLIIPPHLGYGEAGSPPSIPPYATLVFEVELLAVY